MNSAHMCSEFTASVGDINDFARVLQELRIHRSAFSWMMRNFKKYM